MLASKIKTMINSLLIEQDLLSPHLYVDSTFPLEKDSILYDIGAAEGIFSLMMINDVKKAYLFEADSSWLEALQFTFKPWEEKVEIINMFVGDIDSENDNQITLDTFSKQHDQPNFIKADIEGAETKMLIGAKKTLKDTPNLKVSICTYHNQNDAEEIVHLLSKNDFKTNFTNGFMFCYNIDLQAPYLRKALVRGYKNNI
jgi:hypothetical protein